MLWIYFVFVFVLVSLSIEKSIQSDHLFLSDLKKGHCLSFRAEILM